MVVVKKQSKTNLEKKEAELADSYVAPKKRKSGYKDYCNRKRKIIKIWIRESPRWMAIFFLRPFSILYCRLKNWQSNAQRRHVMNEGFSLAYLALALYNPNIQVGRC